jgi:hypothetical protein
LSFYKLAEITSVLYSQFNYGNFPKFCQVMRKIGLQCKMDLAIGKTQEGQSRRQHLAEQIYYGVHGLPMAS